MEPMPVRPEVVHVHAVLPDVTYLGPISGDRHQARVVIDFEPGPHRLTVDTASLDELVCWLTDQKLLAEDVAACVADAVADAVQATVDVSVEQRMFNRVELTPTARGHPGGSP